MVWWGVLAAGLVLLGGLLLSGVPLFVAFLLVNFLGVLTLMGPAGFSLIANSLFDTTNITALAALPLFILMGEILFRAGTIDVLLTSVDGLVAKVRGRQYILVSLLSVIFGALSGSAMGVAAMMGRSIFAGMTSRGYDKRLSAGLIMAGASLAPIIPPSVAVVLLGTLANVSIAKLLIAGVVPGLLLAVLFIIYTSVRIALNPSLSPPAHVEEVSKESSSSLSSKSRAFLRLIPVALIIFSVMGFILLGVATPTEAAATGVVGSIAAALLYRTMSWKLLNEALRSTALASGTVLVIMASSNLFGQLLAFTGTAAQLAELVGTMNVSNAVLVTVMLIITFVFCVFADEIAMMLILVPLFKPIVVAAQINEIWSWLLFLVNLVLGGITPPFGYTMYAFRSGAQTMTINEIYAATTPFVLLFILALILIGIFPGLATFLPSFL